ncbi:MAG: hypothetical protein LLG44_12830 [Chloroflexi bacterium]|nr:hypothetical protein [Chloroflexota bacterium]
MEDKFKVKMPKQLIWIAFGQIIAVLIMPPSVIASISPIIWGVILLIFALLGLSLLRRRAWARIASIFIQGFSIIVRLLIILPNAKLGTDPSSPWNFQMLITSIVSMAFSAVVLYYIDKPEVQTLLQ